MTLINKFIPWIKKCKKIYSILSLPIVRLICYHLHGNIKIRGACVTSSWLEPLHPPAAVLKTGDHWFNGTSWSESESESDVADSGQAEFVLLPSLREEGLQHLPLTCPLPPPLPPPLLPSALAPRLVCCH